MTPFWQTIIFAVVFICILAATIIALVTLAAWQRRQRQQAAILTIANEGNERSRYELRAESASGALSFRFAVGGAPLAPSGFVLQAAPAGVSVPPAAATAPAASVAAPAEPPGPPLASLVAELMVTIGYVLPGSLGTSLRNTASQIRYGQSAADKAGRLSGRVANAAGSAAKTSQQIAGAAGGGQAAPAAATAPYAAGPAPALVPAESWWRTAYVEPGASLAVELQIAPGAVSPGPAETYRVLTRSAERGDAAVVAEDGIARLGGAGGLARWLPFLAVLALALLVSLGAYGAVQAVFPVR